MKLLVIVAVIAVCICFPYTLAQDSVEDTSSIENDPTPYTQEEADEITTAIIDRIIEIIDDEGVLDDRFFFRRCNCNAFYIWPWCRRRCSRVTTPAPTTVEVSTQESTVDTTSEEPNEAALDDRATIVTKTKTKKGRKWFGLGKKKTTTVTKTKFY